jgi:hypothetical protein
MSPKKNTNGTFVYTHNRALLTYPKGLMTGLSHMSRWGVPRTTPPPYLLERGPDPPPT